MKSVNRWTPIKYQLTRCAVWSRCFYVYVHIQRTLNVWFLKKPMQKSCCCKIRCNRICGDIQLLTASINRFRFSYKTHTTYEHRRFARHTHTRTQCGAMLTFFFINMTIHNIVSFCISKPRYIVLCVLCSVYRNRVMPRGFWISVHIEGNAKKNTCIYIPKALNYWLCFFPFVVFFLFLSVRLYSFLVFSYFNWKLTECIRAVALVGTHVSNAHAIYNMRLCVFCT